MRHDRNILASAKKSVAKAADASTSLAAAGLRAVGHRNPSVYLRVVALLVAVLSMVITQSAPAQTKAAGENELKAAFVAKLPLFVSWPDSSFESATSPVVVGLFGRNSFGPYLQAALKDKVAGGRPVKVKICDSLEEAAACQIVFIAESDKATVETILKSLTKHAILTVSDEPDFAERGGILGLAESDRKIRLEVNIDAIQRSALRVDPQLLRISKVVGSTTKKANP